MSRTFEELPEEERLIIRSAILGLNAALRAEAADGVEAAAFKNEVLRSGQPDHIRKMLLANAAAVEFTDTAEISRRHAIITTFTGRALSQLLRELIENGSLSKSRINQVAELFKDDVTPNWQVDYVDGHAAIDLRLTFNSANGMMAYAILRLSELNAVRPTVLQCAECKTFRLIQSTGGDHITKFCSATCRNRFNVREFRRRQAKPRKPK